MADANEDIWAADTLGRKADAQFLIDFLLGRIEQRGKQGLPRSYVLNVDAGWGGGKTFFMSRLAKELAQRDISVAQIDAWQDDHAEDPLLSLMSAVEATVNPLVRGHKALESTYKSVKKAGLAIASAGIKGALKQASRKVLGEAAEAIVEEFENLKDKITEKSQEDAAKAMDKAIDKSAEKLMEGFEEGKKSISVFKTQLGKLTEQIRKKRPDWTLFILIDELDRCRPTHALSLLERIKHLFNVDNVVFVIATDTSQLSHSVCAVYGSGFNGKKYLTRFFDRTYQFPSTSLEQFVRKALSGAGFSHDRISLPPGVSLEQLLIGSLEAFEATLRDTKRAIETLSDIVAAWVQQPKIEGTIAIPLIAGYHAGKLDLSDARCLDHCHSHIEAYLPVEALFKSIDFHRSGPTKVRISKIFLHFLHDMRDIFKAIGNGQDDIAHEWVRDRFSEEFGLIFGSSIEHGRVAPSIMQGYPQLLATAGRLQSAIEAGRN